MENQIKRGDIYWINSNPYRPAVGSMQSGKRPAIIVSNNQNNRYAPTAEVVYLTSSPKKDLPTHCTVQGDGRPSTALCEQVTTVSISEQIGGYIRTCTSEEMDEVERCILISLGIDAPEEAQDAEESEELRMEVYELRASIAAMEVDKDEHMERIAEIEAELARYRAREELLRELYEKAISK